MGNSAFLQGWLAHGVPLTGLVARRYVPMLGPVQANAWERLVFSRRRQFDATLPSPEPAFAYALIRTSGRGQATTADRGTCVPRKREYRGTSHPGARRQEKITSMAGRLACFVTLRTLLPAIKRSPIVVAGERMLGWSSQFSVCEWTGFRNSPGFHAFVLAWIAGHAHEQPRRRRLFM